MEMKESRYAYMLHDKGLFRVNLSDGIHELKVECVFYDRYNFPFTEMGLFSHRHKLYMIGGDPIETGRYPDGSSIYTFDPTRFDEFPVNDSECFEDEQSENFDGEFRPVKWPHMVRTKRMIYFFPNCNGHFFQSFDPVENRFFTLPPPPFVVGKQTRFSSVSGEFILRDYLYLFLRDFRAFSFDTRSWKWREERSMVLQFKEKGIPLPYDHRGDVGLSDDFFDNTHVLVALNGRMPTAYRVYLHPTGSISAKSYRHLDEVYIENEGYDGNMGSLLDLGGGKFCLISYSPTSALVVCVFRIDFALEHEIQISSVNQGSSISSEILSSKKFQGDDVPFIKETWFEDVCLASAPALQSYFASAPSNERLSAMEEGFGRQQYELTAASSNGVAMIDRADATSDQEAEVEAKVKVLELQLEASNKANSALQARLEAMEQLKTMLIEMVKAERKQLKARDEEFASIQDKAIQEWKQSEEFRQAAQSYARKNTHEVTAGPNSEDQDRDGQMVKRNKINSLQRKMGGDNAKKRRYGSGD